MKDAVNTIRAYFTESCVVFALLSVATYSSLGNFAPFFEVAAATRLDGSRNRIRILPFTLLSYLVSVVSISLSIVAPWTPSRRKNGMIWNKTSRKGGYRPTPSS